MADYIHSSSQGTATLEHEKTGMQDGVGERSDVKTKDKQPGFQHSQSHVQGMYLNQPVIVRGSAKEDAQQAKTSLPKEKKKGFFEHRLGAQHLFGTLMTFIYIYRWSKGVKSALPDALVKPREHGIQGAGDILNALKQTEKPFLLAGMVGSLLVNIAVLLSARGAETPEGNSIPERGINSLKNFNESTIQANALLMGGTISAIASSKLKSGLEGIKNNPKGTLAYTEGMASAVSGFAYLVASPIIVLGIMKIKRGDEKNKNNNKQDQPDAFEAKILARDQESDAANQNEQIQSNGEEAKDNSPAFGKSESSIFSFDNLKAAFEPYSPKNLKSSLGYAFEHDKLGLTARTLSVIAEAGFATEGTFRVKKVEAGFYSDVPQAQRDSIMAKGIAARNFGIIGIIVTIAQALYSYGLMYQASLKQQGVDNASQMAR